MRLVFAILAILFTLEQVADFVSTVLIIKKGRGFEQNGIVAWLIARLGYWWWIAKLPLVVVIWWADLMLPTSRILVGCLAFTSAVYALTIWQNYVILWRRD